MTIEELKALIEKANENFLAQKSLNETTELKVKTVTDAHDLLKTKYEALVKTINDGGGEKAIADAKKTADELNELKDEISDLRSKMRNPVDAVGGDKFKSALREIAIKAVVAFAHDGHKADIYEFVGNHAVEQLKTLNITSPEAGGLAIAEVLARDVMDYAREFSPILGEVGRKAAMTRSYRQLIKVTYPKVRKGFENVAGSEVDNTDTQTYAEVKSNDFKVSAEPRVTDEAMSAPDIDVYRDLVESMGDEIAVYLADQIVYGDGSDGEARGILGFRLDITDGTGQSWKPTLGAGRRNADTFPAYATGVSGKIAADDNAMVDFVIKSMAKLPSRYRRNAKWIMNENTKTLFELVRNANGDPIFRADYRTGEFVLNGKPVVIDDTMPDVGADKPFAIYGDLSRAYAINDGDINKMQVNPYIIRGCTVVEYDKEMFEMIQRSDAILIMVSTTNAAA